MCWELQDIEKGEKIQTLVSSYKQFKEKKKKQKYK